MLFPFVCWALPSPSPLPGQEGGWDCPWARGGSAHPYHHSPNGTKAGQVKVQAGLLPWHHNPPCWRLPRALGQQLPLQKQQWWKPAAPGGLCAYNCRKKHPCQRDSLTGVKLGTNPLGPFHLILVFLTSASVSRICSQFFEASKSHGQINTEILGRTENSLHSFKTVLYFKCLIHQSSALPNTQNTDDLSTCSL